MPITFEIEYLRNLGEDCRSCVYLEHGEEHLALHPFQLDNISNSIKELLNKNIARYCRNLNGILLGYDNIKLLSSDGLICDDNCFVHVDIEADFYVFKPENDSTLQGVVSKISKDHVACLVHKTFTITLPKPENTLSWIGKKAQIGQDVQFTIVEAVFDGSLPYIRGNIISLDNIDDSGFSTNEDQQGNDECQVELPIERIVKRRHKLSNSMIEDQEVEELEPPKKKKRKTKENVTTGVEIVPSKPKKGKNKSLENVQIHDSTSKSYKKDKRLKGKLFEDDLLKVDFSVIHNDDYEDSKLTPELRKEKKKSKKRKRNESAEDPSNEISLGERKSKKRKRNSLAEEQTAIANTSTNTEVHNTERAFDSSLRKKYKESKRKNSVDAKVDSIKKDNSSENRKRKDKFKQEGNASDDASIIQGCTDIYEDLLKRLSHQIGDHSLIAELNNLLSEKRNKSKKGKKKDN